MQDCLNYWKSNNSERYIYVGNGKIVQFETIVVFKLLLKIKFYLNFNETFIVLSFQWNLIFSILDKFNYFCLFENWKFKLFHDLKLIDSDSLLYYDNLYLINTIISFNESLHLSTRRAKRKLINKRLDHISRLRNKRLVSNEIVDPLNFIKFDDCVNYIKWKQTNKRRFEINKNLDILELIHRDICGSFNFVHLFEMVNNIS